MANFWFFQPKYSNHLSFINEDPSHSQAHLTFTALKLESVSQAARLSFVPRGSRGMVCYNRGTSKRFSLLLFLSYFFAVSIFLFLRPGYCCTQCPIFVGFFCNSLTLNLTLQSKPNTYNYINHTTPHPKYSNH